MKEKTMTDLFQKPRKLSMPFRVTDGNRFRLKDCDPRDTLDLKSEDKPQAKEALAIGGGPLIIPISLFVDLPFSSPPMPSEIYPQPARG
jgi:hypothetical protein